MPGSISNLGPGFDTLSVAVSLYLRVGLRGDVPAREGIQAQFLSEAPGVDNRIARAFALASERFGPPRHGWRIEVDSAIPMRAGLGSSGAATVAGLRLYEAATSPRPPDDWLRLATEIEGHPDNAAASLLGGLASSCLLDDGRAIAMTRPWPEDIVFVVATPEQGLDTARSRQALPRCVDLRDAIFNLQRAVLLLRALDAHRYDLLREALRDRWHQPHRAPLVPGLAEALALEHPDLLGVCLSGAGPSVVALVAGSKAGEGPAAVQQRLGSVYERLGVPCRLSRLRAEAVSCEL